jgi:hypothetical protein
MFNNNESLTIGQHSLSVPKASLARLSDFGAASGDAVGVLLLPFEFIYLVVFGFQHAII